MAIEAERQNAGDGIVVVPPRGGGGAGSRGPHTETVVSAIVGGEYTNLYPDDENAKAEKWPHGADVRVKFEDGKPDYLLLRPAVHHHGHTLRKKSRGGSARALFDTDGVLRQDDTVAGARRRVVEGG